MVEKKTVNKWKLGIEAYKEHLKATHSVSQAPAYDARPRIAGLGHAQGHAQRLPRAACSLHVRVRLQRLSQCSGL